MYYFFFEIQDINYIFNTCVETLISNKMERRGYHLILKYLFCKKVLYL